MWIAWQEAAVDVVVNTLRGWRRILSRPLDVFFTREVLRTWPARSLVMEFDKDFLKDVATRFNKSSVGVAFNSYDPAEGKEYVYLNDRAAELLGRELHHPSKVRGHRTIYRPIDQ